MFNLA